MSTDERDSFAGLLRTLRRARVLTQEELAEASGVSVRTVRELEAGRVRVPQRRTAALLADVLNLSEQERSRFLVLARGDRALRGGAGPGAAPGANRRHRARAAARAHRGPPAHPARKRHGVHGPVRPRARAGAV